MPTKNRHTPLPGKYAGTRNDTAFYAAAA